MKKGRKTKSQRLVPLNVHVTPEQLQFVIDEQAETERSMGSVIRKLIDNAKAEKLRNAISQGGKA